MGTKLQIQSHFREGAQQVYAASGTSEAYNWNFEENMTDLQLPRYQPKKKKKCCEYIGSTMLFVVKSIGVFLLMTILISSRFLIVDPDSSRIFEPKIVFMTASLQLQDCTKLSVRMKAQMSLISMESLNILWILSNWSTLLSTLGSKTLERHQNKISEINFSSLLLFASSI